MEFDAACHRQTGAGSIQPTRALPQQCAFQTTPVTDAGATPCAAPSTAFSAQPAVGLSHDFRNIPIYSSTIPTLADGDVYEVGTATHRAFRTQSLGQPVRVGGGPVLQHKLNVTDPHDASEREADEIARKVVGDSPSMDPTDTDIRPPNDDAAFRIAELLCPDCKEELASQRPDQAFVAGIQLKSSSPSRPSSRSLSPAVERSVRALAGNGSPLPAGVRTFFESRFGRDFGDVRIHTDTRAAVSAVAMGATAYTTGKDVVFAPGEYSPYSRIGQTLLAHELAHVAQQDPQAGAGTAEVARHTKADCDAQYEECCESCRRLPNSTRRDKARRALCWSSCMAAYAACLASSNEALTFIALVAAIVLAAADGPFPIGDAAAAALLISLGITGSRR